MSVVYLYGFVPAAARLPESGLLGVGEAPVELLRHEGFAAAIGRPDPAVYSAEPLKDRTADMEWMAEQGLRHEQVVAWFVDHGAIVPSRLLTLFSSEAALREAIGDGATIRRDLARFAEAREWDLKVAWDAAELSDRLGAVSEEVARLDQEIAAATPGKRFLLERKRKDLARAEARSTARRLASELLEDLGSHAEDRVILPPPADNAPVVLSAALLVPVDSEAALLERGAAGRERLEALGMTVTLTGPWAPYRFLARDG